LAPTPNPTEAPSEAPTLAPTLFPTPNPTEAPSEAPTLAPTLFPTPNPTEAPTDGRRRSLSVRDTTTSGSRSLYRRQLAGSITLETTISTAVTDSSQISAVTDRYTIAVAAGASDDSLVDSIASELSSGVNASQTESAAFITAVNSDTISIPAVSVAITNYSPSQTPTEAPTVPTAVPTEYKMDIDNVGLNALSIGLMCIIAFIVGTWGYLMIRKERTSKVASHINPDNDISGMVETGRGPPSDTRSAFRLFGSPRVGVAPTEEVMAASPVSSSKLDSSSMVADEEVNEENSVSTIEQLNAKLEKMGRDFNKRLREI
jgi:hypothetical protein